MRCRLPTSLRLLIAAVLAFSALPGFAQQARLAAPDARIGDRVIQADHDTYEAMQARIRTINDGGRPLRDYHLAKAQCWLDTSFHEYTRNDRSAFPEEALRESEKLVVAMEGRQSNLSMDTPLVNGAARLRSDLWARTEALKASSGLQCAARQVACAEVELVHAGNEDNQQQWRHAKPYIQIAEDLIAEAGALADRCVPPPPAPPAVAAPIREETLGAQVAFRFDRSDVAGIVPAGIAQLDALVRQMTAGKTVVRAVRVIGHADRLNGTGHATYNQALSEKRSATVRDLLIARGVSASLIETSARGDRDPSERCEGRFASKTELEACLSPDRRVDIEVRVAR